MANGGTGSFNGLFNGLSSPLIDITILKNTITSIDAITGNVTVVPSVDTKIDIVFPATSSEALQNLINEIVIIGLPQGTENSLTSKLDNVIDLLNTGNENAAINVLNALINQIKALSGKQLTNEEEDELIGIIEAIIGSIG